MASATLDVGSPLDDYFRRQRGEQVADHDITEENDAADLGDRTLVNSTAIMEGSTAPLTPPSKSWTGVIGSPPGPSRPRSVSHAFEERFKYLICSSGVLEKDYVSGLSGEDGTIYPEEDASLTADDSVSLRQPVWPETMARWDPGVAAVVLLLALGRLGGLTIITVLHYLGVLVGLSPSINTPHLLGPPRAASDTVASHPSEEQTASTDALHALEALLRSSRLFDNSVESALAKLQLRPFDQDLLRPLRLAVHQLTINMVDHIGTAASELLPSVDAEELAVLGEMYDIEMRGSTRRRTTGASRTGGPTRRPDGFDPVSVGLVAHSALGEINGDNSSPGRNLRPPMEHRSSSSSSADRPSVPSPLKALAMSASQSLPGHYRWHRHPQHPSLFAALDIPLLSPTDEDRFTQLPVRRQRSAKRSSWDLNSLTRTVNELAQRPKHERRITEADEDAEHTMTPAPVSPALLPSPFDPELERSSTRVVSNPKRRSLQNMPYYKTIDNDVASPSKASRRSLGGADIVRLSSVPSASLQELRARSATGSRRPSIQRVDFDGCSDSSAVSTSPSRPLRPARVHSVSPLTLPALKAACLGVHLKRRKVACCLLGLRFSDPDADDAYWHEVQAVLDTLRSAVEVAREALESSQRQATPLRLSTAADRREDPGTPPRPPWPTLTTFPDQSLDFAPRSSDEARVSDHIESLQTSLQTAWQALGNIHHNLLSGETDTLLQQWSSMRGILGDALRELERGKTLVAILAGANSPETVRNPSELRDQADTDPPPADSTPGVMSALIPPPDLPDFLQTWAEVDHASPPFEDRASSDELPPPGTEDVYESAAAPPPRRSVRERDAESARSRESQSMMIGGMVVEELKGLMGFIREKKGVRGEG